MATIGENRLAIYTLLFQYPLCNYIQNGKLDVLILGDDWVGIEALKAVYWCGIYPKTQLTVTVATEDPEAYKTALEQALPGMKQFEGKAPYAAVRFEKLSYVDAKNSGVDKTLYKNKQVVFVSLGDETANEFVTEEIVNNLTKNSPKTLIAVNETGELPESTDKADVCRIFYGEKEAAELFRIAKNVNFMYTETYTPNAPRKDADATFDKDKKEEFEEAPHDENNLGTKIENFTGQDYNADSSLAAAVHTAYKLARFNNDEQQYADMLKNPGAQFNLMMWWEHCRWNAYMVMRGYRCSESDKEIKEVLKGQSNKDNDRKIHLCLCDCDENGVKKDLFLENVNTSQWSDLDRMSRKIHTIYGKIAREQHVTISDSIKADYPDYAEAANGLINGAPNACLLYAMAQKRLGKDGERDDNIKKLDENLFWHKKWCEKTDYFAIDDTLVKRLLFCRHLKEKKLTVISVAEEYSANTIMTPWVLYADDVKFIMPNNPTYRKDRVQEFFSSDYNVGVKSPASDEPEQYMKKLKEVIPQKNVKEDDEEIVIDITSARNPALLLLIGKEYAAKYPIVAYSVKTGMVKSYGKEIPYLETPGLKSLTIDKFVWLVSGEILRAGALYPGSTAKTIEATPYISYKDIENFADKIGFWAKNECKQQKNRYGEYNCYNDWNRDKNHQLKKFFIENTNGLVKAGCEGASGSSWDYREYVKGFVDALDTAGMLDRKEAKGNHTETEPTWEWNVAVKDEKKDFYNWLFEKNGNFFEGLTYYRLLNTGLFDDVQMGVQFIWNGESDNGKAHNEIDVIATKGTRSLLVSCKTTAELKKEYIYEIVSEAALFGSIPVLAVSQTLTDATFCNRATASGVEILDATVLQDEEKTASAMMAILNGKYNNTCQKKGTT